MRRDGWQMVILFSLLSWALDSTCVSAPGKPQIQKCRSPEKETFMCWWEPGSSGGLPTTHRLLYRREDSFAEVHECPHYSAVEENSCFFGKGYTSIWISYNITVVASNALGNTYSDPIEVDVMDIVQPHAPENVTVVAKRRDSNPYAVVQWSPPHDVDTRSGWITLKYELRVRLETGGEWEVYSADKQRQMSIYSLLSGEVYVVEVRCRGDDGLWSEWSPPAFIKVPHYAFRETSVMVFLGMFFVFMFLVIVGILAAKRKDMKYCLLPPVPGPKIKGFDTKILRSGKSEEIFSALINQSFPLVSGRIDSPVEHLVVFESEDKSESELQLKAKRSTTSVQDLCYKNSLILAGAPREHGAPENEMMAEPVDGGGYLDPTQKLDLPIASTQTWPRGVSVESRSQMSNHYSTLDMCEKDIHHSHEDKQSTRYHPDPSLINTQSLWKDISCNSDQNISISHAGMPAYVYVGQRQERQSSPMPSPEEGQDYSKVSEVVNESTLMLQKDSVSPPAHCAERCMKQEEKKTKMGRADPMADGVTEAQGYVDVAILHFS